MGDRFEVCLENGVYPTKAPAVAGDFYFFSHTNKPSNQPRIPGTIARN